MRRRGRRCGPRTAYPAAHLVEAWAIAPLALPALATGLALAVLTGWSPLRHRWVAIKLTITTLLTAAVFVVLEPGLARAAAAESVSDTQKLPIVLARPRPASC